MSASSLYARLAPVTSAAEMSRARERVADFAARKDVQAHLGAILQNPAVDSLLCALADHSPFLWRLAQADPARLAAMFARDPDEYLQEVLSALASACAATQDEATIMRLLRRARQSTALLIALADLGGLWSLVQITSALSRAADQFVQSALDFLLHDAAASGRLQSSAHEGCGLTILALGKHGACELNYSSDVDLVSFFDPDASALADGVEPLPFYVRITKSLARLLSERTGDGYVLRVDLRLRPDPGSTSVAVALPHAFGYYEMLGQNWERAAFIKARPVAGDVALGAQFLRDLTPFIWRRYFDYAAIADIHAMKRQIHAVRGHAEIVVPGHDVKLGRGGIREVEFFVQTQQLIFGGRRPELRGCRTLDMLPVLERDGWVTAAARDQLSSAYIFLRTIEHRLQMLSDEQTQRLPNDAEELRRFARFCGFPDFRRFSAALTKQLRAVERHYARLFENAPGLDATVGSLVFTGVEDDPDTIETLSGLGFRDPPRVAETVRGWHFGRRPAVQSARAREVMTELVPGLLQSFSSSGEPDAALAAFDAALVHMPAAVELFSILRSNAKLRDLFGDVLGAAPRMAEIVSRHPHVLDAVIDPSVFGAVLDESFFDQHLARLDGLEQTEDFFDQARLMAQENLFAIAIRVLSRMIEARDAGPAFSALASALVRAVLKHVGAQFSREYGVIDGGRIAIVAMGRLGSREMTATSDLDLILVYDFDPARPESDGKKPLHATQYYTRLTQRFISAITAPTRRGILYEIDMRLRPSGSKGPLAVRRDSFTDYQRSEAETWEHLALTRARPIAGDASLCALLSSDIAEILAQPRTRDRLKADVSAMRQMIEDSKGEDNPSDLKIARGGLLDIEFIAQFLVLLNANAEPAMTGQSTPHILAVARDRSIISATDAGVLLAAHGLYSDVLQMQRVILPLAQSLSAAPESALRRIASAVGLPDAARLNVTLKESRDQVETIFNRMLGDGRRKKPSRA